MNCVSQEFTFDEPLKQVLLSAPLSPEIQSLLTGVQNQTLEVINASEIDELLQFVEKNISVFTMFGVPSEIADLLQNHTVMNVINEYIKTKIPHILNKDSKDSYFQFVIFFFLLGSGKFDKITDDFNEYDIEKLEAMYEEYIENILHDQANRSIYIQSFLNLCELINKLCILSQIDTLRTDCILSLKDVMQAKIMKLLALSDELNIQDPRFLELYYFLGRILLNFSHLGFLSLKEKNLDEILENYLDVAFKLREGYKLSERSNFGGDPNKANPTYQVCLGNLSYTMSVMVHKLRNQSPFEESEILAHPTFAQILGVYEDIHMTDSPIHTLDDLKNLTLEVFSAFYYRESFPKIDPVSPQEIVGNFIEMGGATGDYFQLETIHHMVLFCDDFSASELIKLGTMLLSGQRFSHYNFEFMKLKIIDVIINKFTLGSINPEIEMFLGQVVEYIESNKVASQLLYTYARLYFSIAYFYSLCDQGEYQKLSLDYYSLFSRMAINFDYEKYGKELDDYAFNIGIYGLSKDYCQTDCFPACALKGECCKHKDAEHTRQCELEKDKVVGFGHSILEKHSQGYDQKTREDLEEMLGKLLENALKSQQIDDAELHEHLSSMLSKKFFHGIAEIHIHNANGEDEHKYGEFRKNNILVRQITVNLIDDYKMYCIYPKNYTPLFHKILDKNTGGKGHYVLLHIKNIIDLYLTRRKSYIDSETQLPNQSKLSELFMRLTQTKRKASFIKIRLDILEVIQGGYGEDKAKEYIRQVASKLSQIARLKGKVYKLEFADFGIVLDNHRLINQTLESIQGISLSLEGVPLSFNPMVGVVIDESNFWLDKSSMALVAAKQKRQKQGFYNQDNIREAMQILGYATKLKEAIAEDRVLPFFQPIYDAKSLKIYKYEALLRVLTPEGKYDGPYMYLLADGLLDETHIVETMIEKTFQYASVHPGDYSINLSGDDLTRKDLHGIIKDNLQKYNIDPARITFEILEGVWNQNKMHPIMMLKLAGFKIAMDDFGAENSNYDRFLELLEHKQIDYLKIDGKVIKKLTGSDLSSIAIEMLRGVVTSAHLAGVKVVAEFIDSYELALICTTLGVDLLQGYHLSPPVADISTLPLQGTIRH